MHNFLKLATLASSVAAIAVPELEKRASKSYDSAFDDLATNIAAPQLYPVGLYNGLTWGGLVVLRPLEGLASVKPHSPPQHAGAAGPLDLLQLGELTLSTFALVKTGTGVKSFDLNDFWWGFGTDTGTTAGLAQGGTLYVVGYDVKGKQVSANYAIAPASTLNAPLIYADLPDTFKNLQNVTFAVAQSEPISERTYIALDNVRHVNYS